MHKKVWNLQIPKWQIKAYEMHGNVCDKQCLVNTTSKLLHFPFFAF